MNMLEINNYLKKHFPQQLIVFGGSQAAGKATVFSDVDVYIIYESLFQFISDTRDKIRLRMIKQGLENQKFNIHFIPRFFLKLKLYEVRGYYYIDEEKKNFISQGNADILQLNSYKLCLQHLVNYKLAPTIAAQEISLHNLHKNYYFLTGESGLELNAIISGLAGKRKEIKNFLLRDWLLYCLRFRRIFLINFEKIIIACFWDLINLIETSDRKFLVSFYKSFGRLENTINPGDDFVSMNKSINKYVFLIFII